MRTAYSYLILPLAALYGPAATAAEPATPTAQQHPAPAPAPGLTVARDAETGKLRAPTPDEQQALLRRAQAGRPVAPPPPVVTGIHGERRAQLGERGLVYSVVRRGADGQLDRQCAGSEHAAERLLAQPTAATQGDTRHEHR